VLPVIKHHCAACGRYQHADDCPERWAPLPVRNADGGADFPDGGSLCYQRHEVAPGVHLDIPHIHRPDPVKESGVMLNPDCRDAKHTSCNGTGYDLGRQRFADCPCPCHRRTA